MKLAQPNMKQLERLWINDDAMKEAFSRLKNAIVSGQEKEIYASIGETLLWVNSTHDWHHKFNLGDYRGRYQIDEKGMTLLGLRHAFNLMKHNVDFINLHSYVTEPLFSFPFEGDGEFEFGAIHCIWKEAGSGLNGSKASQKRNYIKHLEGKPVIETLESAITFLLKERFPMHIE